MECAPRGKSSIIHPFFATCMTQSARIFGNLQFLGHQTPVSLHALSMSSNHSPGMKRAFMRALRTRLCLKISISFTFPRLLHVICLVSE